MNYNHRKLIGFGIFMLFAIMGTIIAANGVEPQTAQLTLTMSLNPPLDLQYGENGEYFMELNRLENTHKYSSYQNGEVMEPMVISSEENWQLDVKSNNFGHFVNNADSTPTTNPLVFNLYETNVYFSVYTPYATSGEWVENGEGPGVVVSTIMMEPNNLPGNSYTYYPQGEIIVTGDDPAGVYGGAVTFTLSPLLITE